MALTRDNLLEYLSSRMGLDAEGVDDATPLFSSNLLDSFSIVDLMMFIEKQAGIRLDTWDVTLENLDSIERILRYVQTRQAAG
jgi:acyl carrier protein